MWLRDLTVFVCPHCAPPLPSTGTRAYATAWRPGGTCTLEKRLWTYLTIRNIGDSHRKGGNGGLARVIVGIMRILHYEGVRQGREEGRVLAAEGVASITVDVGARLCVLHEHRAAAALILCRLARRQARSKIFVSYQSSPLCSSVMVRTDGSGGEGGPGLISTMYTQPQSKDTVW